MRVNLALVLLGAVALIADVASWNWRVGVGFAAAGVLVVGVLRDDGRSPGGSRTGRGDR